MKKIKTKFIGFISCSIPKYIVVMLKNEKGKWFHHVVNKNGEIISHSESYDSKRNCLDTVKAFCLFTGLTYQIKEG